MPMLGMAIYVLSLYKTVESCDAFRAFQGFGDKGALRGGWGGAHQNKRNVRRRTPPPPSSPSKSPEKIFIGAFCTNVVCVPPGHVQGVSELFALNGMSL